ncbi:MAG: glycosyltransferase family 9 protein [Candidatus Omnitrophica bacterium]|nr:glycosyltransferase family 9 protein [Candidatus Omnitrophota bacterium]
MKPKHKVLIIKVGYSETLTSDISNITSYGDVLRSTVLLPLYKDAHVTWLVDERSLPILKNNNLIHRILIYNLTSVLQLQSEHFDTVINLEKVPGLCALSDSINAWRRYGFRFDVRTGEAEAYDGTHIVLDICRDIEKKRKSKAYWQEGLFEMVGAEWNKEEYSLGYKPKSKQRYDIGFNYQVGNKWPLKAWPDKSWKELEKLVKGKYSVSWQEGTNNIEEYFDWINSCRLLITNDSFGMHAAIALKKKIVALFGPTHASENYLYNLGVAIYPKNFDCPQFPCRLDKCIKFDHSCIALIKPEQVLKEVESLLPKRGKKIG